MRSMPRTSDQQMRRVRINELMRKYIEAAVNGAAIRAPLHSLDPCELAAWCRQLAVDTVFQEERTDG